MEAVSGRGPPRAKRGPGPAGQSYPVLVIEGVSGGLARLELFDNRVEECEVGCGGVGLAEAHVDLAELAHQAAVGFGKLQEEGPQVGDRFMEEGDGLGGVVGVLAQHR